MVRGGAAVPARGAPNEELKLSACAGNGHTPGDASERPAGCAGTGRSLTPVRYLAVARMGGARRGVEIGRNARSIIRTEKGSIAEP
jgi:hypothetical protein